MRHVQRQPTQRWVLPRGATTARPLYEPAPLPQKPDERGDARQTVRGVAGTYQYRMEITILDVSRDGIGVETLERLPFLTRGSLRITLADRHLDWVGEMKWCRVARVERLQEDTRPVFAAGFSLDTSEGRACDELLEALRKQVPLASAWSPGPMTE